LAFLNSVRPPVEAGRGADQLRSALQGGAPGKLGILEVFDGGDMPVDEGIVRERPQVFGRLQHGRIRPQEEQVDVLRHA
jgi:hypothetical protein